MHIIEIIYKWGTRKRNNRPGETGGAIAEVERPSSPIRCVRMNRTRAAGQ